MHPRPILVLFVLAFALVACAPPDDGPVVLVFPISAVGEEARIVERQLARFERDHPEIRIERRVTPDSADQRHQLYVQWLNARSAEPDVLQLDVIWTAELAAAGFLLPVDELELEREDFFPAALAAHHWAGRTWAVPWFVDVGMLYYRTDLVAQPPETFEELARTAGDLVKRGAVRHGFVWQGARYEGLVTVFVEHLGGFGGALLDDSGRAAVDSEPALRSLTWMRASIRDGWVPEAVLGFREEPARFAFQNGEAAFLRNWPYAAELLADPEKSKVAGRFAVAPMPRAPGGEPTAALGGGALAVSAHSAHPKQALELVRFLTAREQMIERAHVAGQLPARLSAFEGEALEGAFPVPARDLLEIARHARPRPVTPRYTELSQVLQVELHRALTAQTEPRAALDSAAREMNAVLDAKPPAARSRLPWLAALLGAGALLYRLRPRPRSDGRDGALALWLSLPALCVLALVALFPLLWTLWESLHAHDLRAPWLGRRFVGSANYVELFSEARFWGALGRTLAFAAISVSLELALGLGLALLLERVTRGAGLARALTLLPWAIPTVVAALLWRFAFEPSGWLSHPVGAWVPLVLADVWKTTPFVALLLLAGLHGIDPRLHEAARVDGANAWQRLLHVTLPELRPAILVALVFRTLDALRVFDLVYVLTGGGPGTSTEPLALLTHSTLLDSLRFGRGAALGMILFGAAFALALAYLRLLRSGREQRP